MHRCLKPGGLAVMSFSNRCFPTKGVWLGQRGCGWDRVGLGVGPACAAAVVTCQSPPHTPWHERGRRSAQHPTRCNASTVWRCGSWSPARLPACPSAGVRSHCGGGVHCCSNNRLSPLCRTVLDTLTAAIAMWTSTGDLDHIWIVGKPGCCRVAAVCKLLRGLSQADDAASQTARPVLRPCFAGASKHRQAWSA